jgi:GTP cyclohydrolase I
MKDQKLEALVRELLLEIGEDPEREGLVRAAPRRGGAALSHLRLPH